MKKETKKAVTNIVADILGKNSETLIEELVSFGKIGNDDLIMTMRIGKTSCEIWKSSKGDDKFEVVISSRESIERMTKKEVLEKILLKAFFNDEECIKIAKKLNED